MNSYKRIFTIVVDSLGVGAMPDAELYGDVGADTLGHIAENFNLKIPALARLGIANLHPLKGIPTIENPTGVFCYLHEKSIGKDTLTGHWEMMGVETKTPFKVFTDTGFPQELISELEKRTGREIVGNKSASGTTIIEELAQEEIQNGKLIVYTSADSVLQICGNEETMGLSTLYRYCEIARELTMKEEWRVARVIARPYTGQKAGEYKRTSNRHDYALSPPHKTYLDALKDAGYDVVSVGKINDIFNGCGITQSNKSKSSVHGMEQTIALLEKNFNGLCFTNLVDFDAQWGHRRNVVGYAEELQRFDEKLDEFIKSMRENDLLILTSDHGTDPTHHGTDHTREKAFFIAYSNKIKPGKIADGDSFAMIGATIAANFKVNTPTGCIGNAISL